MDIKRLKEIIANTKAWDREIKIEKVLNPNSSTLGANDAFIEDVKHHLSTCINKEVFRKWFIQDLGEIATCNCQQHIEKESAFHEFLATTLSMYKDKEDFTPETIIKDWINEKE